MNCYDTIIIGGGLTGLTLTHSLHRRGQSVALVEARDFLGGRYAHQNQSFSPSGLEFFPATEENLQTLQWFQGVSPISFSPEVREHRPQIFEDARWRPFAGFGSSEFKSISELSYLSHTHDISISPGLDQVVRTLVEQLPVAALTRSEVTKIAMVEDVVHVTINGDKDLCSKTVIFTPPPIVLNDLIEGEGLNAKTRTFLAKTEPWATVTLELNHLPPLVEDNDVRIFSHGSKEFEPVFGRVFGNISRWQTLVPSEQVGDHEFVGQCIRHIKRQLKRAWPLALEGKVEERIFVHPSSFGQMTLKGKSPFRLNEQPLLWLANHLLSASPGEIGPIAMAKAIDEALRGAGIVIAEPTASC